MKKYYLCGFLIICLFLCHPIQIIAEEVLPPIEDPIEDPIEGSIEDPVEEPVEPQPEPQLDPPSESQPDPPLEAHQLIINEVMIGSEVNPEKDNWIEFYNPTDTKIILETISSMLI